MNRAHFFRGSVIAVACAAMTAIAPAQDRNQDPTERNQPETREFGRDRGAVPGQLREELNKLIGTWDLTIRVWAAPESAPEEGEGRSTREWILNDHYIEEEMQSQATELLTKRYLDRRGRGMENQPQTDPLNRNRDRNQDQENEGLGAGQEEQPDDVRAIEPQPGDDMNTFRGKGLFGVDPGAGQLAHIWMDSHSYEPFISVGRVQPAERAITFEPVMAGTQRFQTEHPTIKLRIVSEDEHVLEYYSRGATGDEMKVMEITYTRRGAGPGTP